MVKVTQADRDLAADIAQLHLLYPTDTIDRIRDGELDHLGIVQRVAHRTASAPVATEAMVDALKQCRDQFAFYAREHTAAGKLEKAATNQRFADMATEALAAMGGADADS